MSISHGSVDVGAVVPYVIIERLVASRLNQTLLFTDTNLTRPLSVCLSVCRGRLEWTCRHADNVYNHRSETFTQTTAVRPSHHTQMVPCPQRPVDKTTQPSNWHSTPLSRWIFPPSCYSIEALLIYAVHLYKVGLSPPPKKKKLYFYFTAKVSLFNVTFMPLPSLKQLT